MVIKLKRRRDEVADTRFGICIGAGQSLPVRPVARSLINVPSLFALGYTDAIQDCFGLGATQLLARSVDAVERPLSQGQTSPAALLH
jgi:hypothetical protein